MIDASVAAVEIAARAGGVISRDISECSHKQAESGQLYLRSTARGPRFWSSAHASPRRGRNTRHKAKIYDTYSTIKDATLRFYKA